MTFPAVPAAERLKRLEPPTGSVRMVLDTDTFNEVDDRFAIVQALLSPERLQLEALYAAPFSNHLADNAERGMGLSFEEILRVLARLNEPAAGRVLRGSRQYLPDERTPVESEAAHDLVARALSAGDEPLYVVAIGAPTNVAAALLLEPQIVHHVVVWLGGHALHWPTAHEFNLQQDLAANRVLLGSGVPLVLVPCMGVTSHLTTTTVAGRSARRRLRRRRPDGRGGPGRLYRGRISVPDTVALVGFDDAAYSRLLYPPLTTIRQPAYPMGRKAAELAVLRLAGKTPDSATFAPELVVRGSAPGRPD